MSKKPKTRLEKMHDLIDKIADLARKLHEMFPF